MGCSARLGGDSVSSILGGDTLMRACPLLLRGLKWTRANCMRPNHKESLRAMVKKWRTAGEKCGDKGALDPEDRREEGSRAYQRMGNLLVSWRDRGGWGQKGSFPPCLPLWATIHGSFWRGMELIRVLFTLVGSSPWLLLAGSGANQSLGLSSQVGPVVCSLGSSDIQILDNRIQF